MNSYVKAGLVAITALAASAAIAARPNEADPTVIQLPSSVVSSVLVYLNARPYQEVASIINNMQRCIQDQVPDANGAVVEHGGCPEIAANLRRLKAPPPKLEPSPH